jgi:hypothetical protein
MNTPGIIRLTALYMAAVFSILLTGCILIAHDISDQFRQVLVSLTGHHWITMSILSILIYLVFLIFFAYAVRSERVARLMKADKPFLWSVLLALSIVLMTGSILFVYVLQYTA